ncbi:subtilisin-like protein [Rhizoclosmatium globosum]|uniref:Subtilisin-like protein n=1 Tax=Rhizoclosmatium globosum TaxID=329046 RepID=A0A1Y2C4L8_9FUNG|nr:subtilisin-like protein [Rhizoclosmatium globosum]|eukprot:ORY41834.1 subtilisin-like protein [Rhizoclosmatium globosum]
MVHFPQGVDAKAQIQSHFAATNTPYSIRVAVNNKYANFASFTIENGGACVSIQKSEVQQTPELIHTITGVNDARKLLKLTGKGLNVAVIDSGVHYLHPALGGGFGPGYKVAKGYDFVGDAFTGQAGSPPPTPDSDPLDACSEESHGTHVAGIIAADARNITQAGWIPSVPFTGVAPDATIFAYRIFGCTGSTSSDLEAAAIYQAAADGAHVINLSIGGGPDYYDDSAATYAAEVVSKDGHFVVASAGNDGAAGTFVTGSPAVGRSALGVASFDNVAAPQVYMTVDGAKFIYNVGSANPTKFADGQVLDIVVNNLDADVNDVQDDANGKAMLIRWGDTAKGGSAARCASACILYSNNDAMSNILGAAQIPSMFIPRAAGQAILAAIKAGKAPKVVATWQLMNMPIKTAATLSDFSSPGLDNELWFKPDLGGIGGQRVPSQGFHENYGVMSGTSMASPYVAGKRKHHFQRIARLPPEYRVSQTSLRTELHSSPSYQGAGLINAYAAASIKTIVLPSAIALNDTVNLKQSYNFTITNNYKFDQNYYLNNNAAATVRWIWQEAWDFKLVRVKAGKSVTVSFQITPPSVDSSLYAVYGGYISIVNDYDDNVISVPYAGVVGDWKNRNIWTRKSASLASKWLIPSVKSLGFKGDITAFASTGAFPDLSFKTPVARNAVVNMTSSNGLFLLPLPSMNARFAEIQAIYQGADITPLLKAGFASRSVVLRYGDILNGGTRPGYFEPLQRTTFAKAQSIQANGIYQWTGIGYNKVFRLARLPPGPYRIVFAAQKNFGDEYNNDDFDVVASEAFNLVY